MHKSVSTLPGRGRAVGLCVYRQESSPVGTGAGGSDRCPPAGHWRGAGGRGVGTGPAERGTHKARHDSPQVSQCSDKCTAKALDGSCYLNKPVVNKWSLLVLIGGEPQACKPPRALQL